MAANHGTPTLQTAVEEIRSLQRKIATIEKEHAEQNIDSDDKSLIESQPLRLALWDSKVPDNFKSPHLPTFDGKTDPLEHLMVVGTQNTIIGAPEHLRCKLLSGTFKDAALHWYMNLPKNSIESYADFYKKFIHQFSGTKHIKVTATRLFTICQNYAETLREYLARFIEATIKVSNTNQEMFVAAFHNGLKARHFNESLAQKPATSMQEVIKRTSCYIKDEESNAEKRSRDAKEKDMRSNNSKGGIRQTNRARVHVLHKILQTGLAPLPPPRMNNIVMGPDTEAWCAYHRCKGHDTEICFRLRDLIEDLIRSGHLRKFLEDAAKGQIALPKQMPYPPKGEGNGGYKGEKHRVAVRNISVGNSTFLHTPEISFNAEDGRDVTPHNDDPLVIQVQILKCDVKRVLIDSGSSADILYWDTFKAMHLSYEQLYPYYDTLVGFAGEQVDVMGHIALYTTFGEGENAKTIKSVITHKLSISSTTKPVVQRKRKVGGSGQAKGNLNKACPKDPCPLPNIDRLTEGASGYKTLEFYGCVLGLQPYQDEPHGCTTHRLHVKHLQLLLQCYAIWLEECRSHLPTTDGQSICGANREKSGGLHRRHGSKNGGGEKACHFFATLRKNERLTWSPQCEEAFQKLRVFLASSRILTRPEQGKTLYLYLAVFEKALSSTLVQEIEGVEKPIYFVSRTLRGAETRYQKIERLSLVVVITARKLRQYFQSHQVVVKTNYPIKNVLRKPGLTGRMVAWSVELSEFDITYMPRGAIKSQALGDFVLELTNPQPWTLSVDDSSNLRGSGVGVVLEGSEGVLIEQSLRFAFKASNNQAEYEALIAGMKLAREMEVQELKAQSDSQLVANQVAGEFQTKDPQLAKYLEKVQEMAKYFTTFELTYVPREQNARADLLAKLASIKKPGDQGKKNDGVVNNGGRQAVQERIFSSHASIAGRKGNEGWIYWPNLHDDATRQVLFPYPRPKQDESSWRLTTSPNGWKQNRYQAYRRTSGGILQRKGDPKHFHLCGTTSSQWASRISEQGPQGSEEKNKLQTRELGGAPPWNIAVISYNATIFNRGTALHNGLWCRRYDPVEVQPSSWRRDILTLHENNTVLEESLDLLPKLREKAHFKEFYTKQRAARKYNTRVIPRKFKEGDLVLKNPWAKTREERWQQTGKDPSEFMRPSKEELTD
ncbi:hypothetical protein TSUD_299800 [Trifolium subterraneum]|uniref:RNase H type-1 domain-containing protein n=1 Tax=Trifolium subterraneum TaxID=3900 RepID=A0A2Z6NAR2_TRISU|nr:hypothetical protein TSUD_299800 [Trifolium subterraneum]